MAFNNKGSQKWLPLLLELFYPINYTRGFAHINLG